MLTTPIQRGDAVSSIHRPAYRRLVKLIGQARRRAGLTQVEVARRLGKPQSFVSSCESGQRRIDLIELDDLGRVYGIRLTWFLKAFES
jgi:transcriptional regulator with XRE-family HTH domain